MRNCLTLSTTFHQSARKNINHIFYASLFSPQNLHSFDFPLLFSASPPLSSSNLSLSFIFFFNFSPRRKNQMYHAVSTIMAMRYGTRRRALPPCVEHTDALRRLHPPLFLSISLHKLSTLFGQVLRVMSQQLWSKSVNFVAFSSLHSFLF